MVATDPTTGKTAVKVVTDVRSHQAAGALYEVSVRTDSGVGTITVTDEHPFWVDSLNRWVNAEDLKPGYRFTTADGRPATVTGTRSFADVRRVYNLTVDSTHTYYVQAGTTPVLVHNCDDNDGLIDPSTMRFSQKGVSPNFTNGNSIEETAEALRRGEVDVNDFPAIRLVERDGAMFTLDHRRLVAFQKAGVPEVPYRMATPREARREKGKFDTEADGLSIRIRGGGGIWSPQR